MVPRTSTLARMLALAAVLCTGTVGEARGQQTRQLDNRVLGLDRLLGPGESSSVTLRAPFCAEWVRVDIEARARATFDRVIGYMLASIPLIIARECPSVARITYAGRVNGDLVFAAGHRGPDWGSPVAIVVPP